MKKITVLLLPLCGILLSAVGFAQVQQPDYSTFGFSSAKINGRIQVSRFDYNVPSLSATSFGNWSSFPNGCRYNVPGYGATVPFSTSATVKVNDLTTPANTETVSLTGFTSAAPNCSVTLSTVNPHYRKLCAAIGHLPGSKPDQIAEVVYEAATDGKEQLRYVAGAWLPAKKPP